MSVNITNAGGVDILVYGDIGWDVLARDVAEKLIELGDDAPVNVRINSVGGSVVDGHGIYNALNNHAGAVTVTIDGAAMSAASYIAMAGDKIRIASNGFLMIHDAANGAYGDAEEMQKNAEILTKISNSIAETYANRTGISVDRIRVMMQEETWLTASEAKALGFVDEVLPADGESKNLGADVLAKAPAKIVAMFNVQKPQVKGSSDMADKVIDKPTNATSKEIKAVCDGAPAEFVLEQLENEATIDQVKDAWMKVLAQANADAEAKNVDLANELQKEKEAAAKASKPSNSGVAPVGVDYECPPAGGTTGDPIVDFEASVAKLVKGGKTRRQAMSAVVASDPEAHKAYLDAANA